jgi:hypothetical protein
VSERRISFREIPPSSPASFEHDISSDTVVADGAIETKVSEEALDLRLLGTSSALEDMLGFFSPSLKSSLEKLTGLQGEALVVRGKLEVRGCGWAR